MDTKKKKVFKVIKDVALYVWMCIKSACVGFVVGTLTFAFTCLFCKGKASRLAAYIGAITIGAAATKRMIDEDKSIGELADDIVEIYDNIKAKKEAEASENVVTE